MNILKFLRKPYFAIFLASLVLFVSCSQDTLTEDSVLENKTSTLEKIYKESLKCDSLKVAYTAKSIALNNIISSNLSIFKELESERLKRSEIEKQYLEANKKLLKESKKKNNNILYGTIGISAGLIIGILLN